MSDSIAAALPRCLGGGPADRLMIAVENIGIEVVAVRPYDGAKLGIDAHLAEVRGVLQRLGHRTPEIVGEIDLADESIRECQSQPKALERFDDGDASKWADIAHGSGSMLGARVSKG